MATTARADDGTIQLTFILPWAKIQKTQSEVVTEAAKTLEIPGFRKGKAPAEKVKEKIGQALVEKTLAKVLPTLLAEAIAKEKIKPIIYPKIELVHAHEGEDWEVRATTAEMPEISLGDYKAVVSGELRAASLKKELAKPEKEQIVIKALLDNIKLKIAKVVTDAEVDARLSALLARIEKLGLTLEGYLASLGKTPEGLREEYQKQAEASIGLELILNKMAEEMKIEVKEAEIDEAVAQSAAADTKLTEKLNTPEQRSIIRNVLARRAAIDALTALI